MAEAVSLAEQASGSYLYTDDLGSSEIRSTWRGHCETRDHTHVRVTRHTATWAGELDTVMSGSWSYIRQYEHLHALE